MTPDIRICRVPSSPLRTSSCKEFSPNSNTRQPRVRMPKLSRRIVSIHRPWSRQRSSVSLRGPHRSVQIGQCVSQVKKMWQIVVPSRAASRGQRVPLCKSSRQSAARKPSQSMTTRSSTTNSPAIHNTMVVGLRSLPVQVPKAPVPQRFAPTFTMESKSSRSLLGRASRAKVSKTRTSKASTHQGEMATRWTAGAQLQRSPFDNSTETFRNNKTAS